MKWMKAENILVSLNYLWNCAFFLCSIILFALHVISPYIRAWFGVAVVVTVYILQHQVLLHRKCNVRVQLTRIHPKFTFRFRLYKRSSEQQFSNLLHVTIHVYFIIAWLFIDIFSICFDETWSSSLNGKSSVLQQGVCNVNTLGQTSGNLG